MRKKIIFYLNGKRQEADGDKASLMLADYLRIQKHLTGTKIVCAEGDCGACSVLRLFPHGQQKNTNHFVPINSCISLVAQLDGSSIITVEALKDHNRLHETQRAMIECHGSQCGFCTPGFVVSLCGLVEEKINKKELSIDAQEAKNCLTGNLCRCTGYQPIIDAALNINLSQEESLIKRFYSFEQEQELNKAFNEGVKVESDEFLFFAPKTISEALEFLKNHPDTKIIASGTDLGVVHNKRKIKLTKLLSLHLVEELYKSLIDHNEVNIGARVTLTDFRHLLKKALPELANYLDVFASPQIKNVATVVGNIANASPIGDTPPALMALDTRVVVASLNGQKEIPLSEFYLGYKKLNLNSGDIITGIKFKIPSKKSELKISKNANRKDLDISAINFAIKVDWKDDEKTVIDNIFIATGGVAATPLRLKATETYLKNHPQDIDGAVKELHQEIKPISDLRATSSYRHIVAENYLRRFFLEARSQS